MVMVTDHDLPLNNVIIDKCWDDGDGDWPWTLVNDFANLLVLQHKRNILLSEIILLNYNDEEKYKHNKCIQQKDNHILNVRIDCSSLND